MTDKVDYEKHLIKSFIYWNVYLHENQAYLGRCYIALKRNGNLDPYADTTEAERQELQKIMVMLQKTISKLYKPDMFNYANLRNLWHHCHWHVIPRYKTSRTIDGERFTDNNWGKNYTPYNYKLRTSETLMTKIKESIQEGLIQ